MEMETLKNFILFLTLIGVFFTCLFVRRNQYNNAVRQLFRNKLHNKKLDRDKNNRINYFYPNNVIAPPEVKDKKLRQKHIQYSLEMMILLGGIIPVLAMIAHQIFNL